MTVAGTGNFHLNVVGASNSVIIGQVVCSTGTFILSGRIIYKDIGPVLEITQSIKSTDGNYAAAAAAQVTTVGLLAAHDDGLYLAGDGCKQFPIQLVGIPTYGN